MAATHLPEGPSIHLPRLIISIAVEINEASLAGRGVNLESMSTEDPRVLQNPWFNLGRTTPPIRIRQSDRRWWHSTTTTTNPTSGSSKEKGKAAAAAESEAEEDSAPSKKSKRKRKAAAATQIVTEEDTAATKKFKGKRKAAAADVEDADGTSGLRKSKGKQRAAPKDSEEESQSAASRQIAQQRQRSGAGRSAHVTPDEPDAEMGDATGEESQTAKKKDKGKSKAVPPVSKSRPAARVRRPPPDPTAERNVSVSLSI